MASALQAYCCIFIKILSGKMQYEQYFILLKAGNCFPLFAASSSLLLTALYFDFNNQSFLKKKDETDENKIKSRAHTTCFLFLLQQQDGFGRGESRSYMKVLAWLMRLQNQQTNRMEPPALTNPYDLAIFGNSRFLTFSITYINSC